MEALWGLPSPWRPGGIPPDESRANQPNPTKYQNAVGQLLRTRLVSEAAAEANPRVIDRGGSEKIEQVENHLPIEAL